MSEDNGLHGPQVPQIDYSRWMLTRMKALAESFPEAAEQVQPMVEHWEKQIAALEAVEAIAAAPTDEMTLGYQKDATGAYKPRPVVVYAPVGNVSKPHTGKFCQCEACNTGDEYPGGADIRVDPPYDR